MKVTEFIGLLKRNVSEEKLKDHNKVLLNVIPKKGWKFNLSCNLSNLMIEDDYIFANNYDSGLSAIDLLLDIDECHHGNKDIVFEVYGVDESNINNQIIIVDTIVSEDITIKTENNNIVIDLYIELSVAVSMLDKK